MKAMSAKRREALRSAGAYQPWTTFARPRPGGARETGNPAPKQRDTGPDRRTRAAVLIRDGYMCADGCGPCGPGIAPYSIQHRKRRSQGGTSAMSNLILVAGTGTAGCHLRIDSRIDPQDEARGYTVRSFDDPRLIPVMYFERDGSGAAKYLDDDGNLSDEPPGAAA